jgi:NitT/TauT family transport system permease protein
VGLDVLGERAAIHRRAGWLRESAGAGLALVLPPALCAALLLAAWAYLTGRGIIPRYLLPSPQAIGKELTTHTAVLARHAGVTLEEALGGFAIGNAAAVALSLVFAWSAPVRRALYPLALATRAVPIVAVTPLLVIAFGYGIAPIVAVVAISVYFPTLLNMVRGLQSADVEYQELLHVLSASRLQRLCLIELPASLPYLFAALKVGASTAFISAIVGEWIGSGRGLGFLIVESGYHFRLATLWSAVAIAGLLTLLTIGLVGGVERLAVRGRPPAVGAGS